MERYTISNVEVEFPFRAYPCQLVYMEKVIQALQQGTNAILESPTGTGKTLCLLCATLAWREGLVRQQQAECGEGGEEEGEEGGGEMDMWDIRAGSAHRANVPKIIYASRTHSQLSQVIHELKNTKYRPRVAIIGSREQLCILPEVVKKETNAEKVHLCRAKVQGHSCMYYNNTDVRRLKTTERVMDIEDLVMAGSRQRMCPYYLAREMKSEADIIFMPYNYILDMKTRHIHGVDIQGTVVILDEAHNIERVCEDSASFDLTSMDIAHCISDITHLLVAKKEEESLEEEGGEIGDDITDLLNLKEFFLTVEKNLDSMELKDPAKGEMVQPGEFIFDFFAKAGLTPSTYSTLMDQCGKAISLLTTGLRSLHLNGNNVQKFVDAAKVVFTQPCGPTPQSSARHYKVFVKVEEAKKKKRSEVIWTVSSAESARKENRTLSYWCFSPGRAMADLTAQGVRSIVLTSGTLSPMDSFCSELQVDFPIQYEGPHVISKEQVWVGVVSKGCDNVALNSSYANRFKADYQSSLGNTIVNFARIIPHGLLVFFPSYPVMNNCVDVWTESGILSRVEQYKPVFTEPRRKTDFGPTMDAFYEKIVDPKHSGAAFFAVCRGKVSEGLDFADINGRAVVITGLPYPPRMDPKVGLKMQYLEETLKRLAIKGLSGEDWYKQQASRAVNQAVGRVIRHRRDYGAIILCDERFTYGSAISQLPRWLRPYVRTYDKFGLVQRDLTQFFRNAEKEFGVPAPKKQVVSGGDEPAGPSTAAEVRGFRMPIVVRDPAKSVHRLQAQDASVIDVHVTSKGKQPEASLAKVKAEEDTANKSLLTSLLQCDQTDVVKSKLPVDLHVPERPPTGPSLSEAIMGTSSLNPFSSSFPPSSSSSALAKKPLKVVKRRPQADKAASVAGFISELQDCLSDEAYRKFKTSLAAYKKNEDIYMYMDSLKEIFRNPSMFHFLRRMYSFVLEKDKKTYRDFYSKLTGNTLEQTSTSSASAHGKRKAVLVPKEQPKRKQSKFDKEFPSTLEHQDKPNSSLLDTQLLNTCGHLKTT